MKAIAAGTFDRLHEGHRHFLLSAFSIGYVYIGLTSDEMVKNKPYAESIQNYENRRENLIKFLLKEGKVIDQDFQIIEIKDRYGFAIESMEADVIVVTSDTIEAAKEINEIRAELGIYPLDIVEVDLIIKDNKKISSSDFRKEEKD
ncbi:MAG: Phosphopantetheine adenylyltransferase [Candidatus Methanofastidiosum methylothiophilum]|uniref:Phosphopantetheine adenylyltransferase n=1 Tax=Candidatus Methanofastidiosum methylothiophilum TaxID=1705564 RepID=A0A150IYH6_9EURY|nr:MAG: Phosphopantetheine adenylyltransferase [Candidatus Methanofastidiosum methylthiophilus]KYC46551.1 MAG: Phosphopantetheine adenylyltransferase [Candidatus Methanofastidiosum methylthiophilus]KYC49714.1 MAG: Phosphopantetheine adenylyltransferase [Candidatus Methanofastidiosum methylthiophilus]